MVPHSSLRSSLSTTPASGTLPMIFTTPLTAIAGGTTTPYLDIVSFAFTVSLVTSTFTPSATSFAAAFFAFSSVFFASRTWRADAYYFNFQAHFTPSSLGYLLNVSQ